MASPMSQAGMVAGGLAYLYQMKEAALQRTTQESLIQVAGGLFIPLGVYAVEQVAGYFNCRKVRDLAQDVLAGVSAVSPGGTLGTVIYVLGGKTLFSAAAGIFTGIGITAAHLIGAAILTEEALVQYDLDHRQN